MVPAKDRSPYGIIPLKPFRKTSGVQFDILPMELFPKIDAIDRVIHKGGAVSPGPVGDDPRPWYMHTCQEDHLLVLHGAREVELYWPTFGKIEIFRVTSDKIEKNGIVVHNGPGMLSWARGVFHRIKSDEKNGSASLNIALRYDGFDINTNFNVYGLDTKNGNYKVIRPGYLDQR